MSGVATIGGKVYDVTYTPRVKPSVFILGVNTHLGWPDGGYSNIDQTIKALQYLGVKYIRDSCTDVATIALWQRVALATGAKFINFLPGGPATFIQSCLNLVPQMATAKLLSHLDGVNESDNSYAASQGMTLDQAKRFQQQVWAVGQKAGVKVINLSVGAGWSAPLYEGNYPNIGDQSAYCDFGNAHTYPQNGHPPASDIIRFTNLAKMGATQRPVIHTEFGYPLADVSGGDAVSQALQGEYLTQGVDAAKAMVGAAGLLWYGLYDDRAGQWGLFNNDGTPRPAATAFRNIALAG